MRLIDRLARLDAIVIPRLARGLVRVRGQLSGRRPNTLTVAALVLVISVALVGMWRANHPYASGGGGSSPVRVGVQDGDLIGRYVAASRNELDQLVAAGAQRRVYALVSFAMYVDPSRLRDLVNRAGVDIAAAGAPAMETAVAYARVPLPRRQTQIVRLAAERVPDDVVASMAAVAEQKAADAARYSQRSLDESGAQLRAIYESNAALAASEAQAYRLGCACVYALVVRATPVALRALAGCPEIRVVDAAPEVADLGSGVFVAPLPEQLDRVVPPRDDALPVAPSGPGGSGPGGSGPGGSGPGGSGPSGSAPNR